MCTFFEVARITSGRLRIEQWHSAKTPGTFTKTRHFPARLLRVQLEMNASIAADHSCIIFVPINLLIENFRSIFVDCQAERKLVERERDYENFE